VHYHSRGRIAAEETCKLFEKYGLSDKKNIIMSDYIYNMPVLMAAADLVICRAGAMTLSEIAAMKKAAIVIPSPNVTDNHQYKNAKVLSDAGAAVLVEESELDKISIANIVKEVAEDRKRRQGMEDKISDFVRADVSKLIYKEIKILLDK
jgi:UDP-N-acetylglucosamine--N-acetylmuramyl-(pentapeptide) pyrophosphoryl-undecaprenol N-acetylglucosamine transferase